MNPVRPYKEVRRDAERSKRSNGVNVIIVGAQWGDEGKGKIIDILSAETDFIVRYQGGNNAGHTVVVRKKRIYPPFGAVRGTA